MLQELINFCQPYYEAKDDQHGLEHIERISRKALNMAKNMNITIDSDLLQYAAYFHGMVEAREKEIMEFLAGQKLRWDNELVLAVAKDSLKNHTPETEEGKLLHDAHLLEGDEAWIFHKSMLTGTMRGQTETETAEYFKKHIYRKNKCHYGENQKELERREDIALEMFRKFTAE